MRTRDMRNTDPTQTPRAHGAPLSLALLLALSVAATGCTAQLLGGSEGQEHGQAEMLVNGGEVSVGWVHDGEWAVSPPLEAPDGASRVGVMLQLSDATTMPIVEARALVAGMPAGDWIPVHTTWSEEEHHVGVAELGTVGDGAQIRVVAGDEAPLVQLRFNAVLPEEGALTEAPLAEAPSGEVGAAREALRSELSGLGIVTREAWGARATRCTGRNTNKTRMAIHYTVTPSQNPERQVRAIQRYHQDSNGWCDVGYHFLIGIDGQIYEGRPLDLVGAHVGGHNTGNIGISYVGCFNNYGCDASWGPLHPPEAMIQAGGRLVGALSRLYGIPVTASNVKGHREHSGASTSCPGSYLLARLGDIRAVANGAAPAPAPTGGSCTHSYGGSYANAACSAGYQCCDGRWSTRGSCGSCLCTEATGYTGCTEAASEPAPAPTEPPAGASCAHSYGGSYANTACSASYQCCDGRWGTRGSCGSCFCTEESGHEGCGVDAPAPPAPPAGASCAHSYGGSYANTACSAGYQCCDGRWGTRGACGSCYCTEETGRTGCGTR